MGIYKHFVILGGGGGNEIANKLCVYDVSDRSGLSANQLNKLTHEESTGADMPTHIETALVSALSFLYPDQVFCQNINVLAVCMGPNIGIYKLDPKVGKLELFQKFQADFKAEEPNVNCCKWFVDNKAIAVGGDDMVVRVY